MSNCQATAPVEGHGAFRKCSAECKTLERLIFECNLVCHKLIDDWSEKCLAQHKQKSMAQKIIQQVFHVTRMGKPL